MSGRPISERLRLGIDVGGTNTDAALLCGKEVVATAKSFTTADVRSGVVGTVTRSKRS
jgi:N-methylhydantoinase A/oxoprolinase/acetone carboxylase beta subunit